MERKQTIIANMRAEIKITHAFERYLSQYADNPDAWFSRAGGDVFLGEFGGEWNSIFVEYLNQFFINYFPQLGVQLDGILNIELTDSRRGSWIMEATMSMFASVGTTYAILKGVGELPKIADGIEETKSRIETGLQNVFRKKVSERIEPYLDQLKPSMLQPVTSPEDPPNLAAPVTVSFFIDACPLRGLTPDKIHSHSIHLSVGLSRSALSVENLGEVQLVNVRIRLFKSPAEMHSWALGEAYSKSVPTLNAKQTISLSIPEFRKYGSGSLLMLDETTLFMSIVGSRTIMESISLRNR